MGDTEGCDSRAGSAGRRVRARLGEQPPKARGSPPATLIDSHGAHTGTGRQKRQRASQRQVWCGGQSAFCSQPSAINASTGKEGGGENRRERGCY